MDGSCGGGDHAEIFVVMPFRLKERSLDGVRSNPRPRLEAGTRYIFPEQISRNFGEMRMTEDVEGEFVKRATRLPLVESASGDVLFLDDGVGCLCLRLRTKLAMADASAGRRIYDGICTIQEGIRDRSIPVHISQFSAVSIEFTWSFAINVFAPHVAWERENSKFSEFARELCHSELESERDPIGCRQIHAVGSVGATYSIDSRETQTTCRVRSLWVVFWIYNANLLQALASVASINPSSINSLGERRIRSLTFEIEHDCNFVNRLNVLFSSFNVCTSRFDDKIYECLVRHHRLDELRAEVRAAFHDRLDVARECRAELTRRYERDARLLLLFLGLCQLVPLTTQILAEFLPHDLSDASGTQIQSLATYIAYTVTLVASLIFYLWSKRKATQ